MLWCALSVLGLAAGCSCEPFGESRFVCATQADCAEGFECSDVGGGLECVRAGTGTDAGNVDAGEEGDAGDADAGADADAGDQDAGEDAGMDTDAGADAGLDAGTDAGVDAGADAGIDAGADGGAPATALRFATAPQTVLSGGCTAVVVMETVNAGGTATPVSATTAVTLSGSPNGVSFFTTSTCGGTAITSVTIAANASSATFYASGSPARTYTLVANSPPLTGASQALVVANPPTSLVFTTTPPNPVRGGTCVPATVEARRGATATPVVSTTSLGLTVVPSGAARFFSDAACTTSATTASMLAGASTSVVLRQAAHRRGQRHLRGGALRHRDAEAQHHAHRAARPVQLRGVRGAPRWRHQHLGAQLHCAVSPALTDLSASLLWSRAPPRWAAPSWARSRCAAG